MRIQSISFLIKNKMDGVESSRMQMRLHQWKRAWKILNSAKNTMKYIFITLVSFSKNTDTIFGN